MWEIHFSIWDLLIFRISPLKASYTKRLVLKVGLLSQISQMNVFFQPALDRQCDGGGRCKQHAWVSLIYPMYSKTETQFAQNVRLSPLCNKCSNRPTLQLWDVCCLWRPSQWSSLWGRQLRGVQGEHQSQDSARFSSNNAPRVSSSGPWGRTRGTSAGWTRTATWTRTTATAASIVAFRSALPWACAVTVRVLHHVC